MSDSTAWPGKGFSPRSGSATSGVEKSLLAEAARRPSLLAMMALAIGLSSAYSMAHLFLLAPLLLLLRDRRSLTVLLIFSFLGFLLRPQTSLPLVTEERLYEGVVQITSVPRPGPFGFQAEGAAEGQRYWIRGEESDWDVSMGDVLMVKAQIKPLKEYEDSSRGSIGVIQLVEEPHIVREGFFFWRWGRELQRSFSSFVKANFEPADAAMLDALCFSTSTDLDPTLRSNIRRTGLSHVVAASGLQVTIMATALFWLFLRLPIDRRGQLLLLIPILILYAAAAGMRASIMRAIIMGSVILGAWIFRREPDGLAAIGAAGTINLVIDPESIVDIGFILSYSAMLAIVLFSPVKEEPARSAMERMLQGFRQIFWASLAAGAATAPVIAYFFGEFSSLGLFANLFIVPVVPFATIGALGGWALSLISPALGTSLIEVTAVPFIRWLTALSNTVGPMPASAVPIPWFSPYLILVPWVVVLMWWRPRVRSA